MQKEYNCKFNATAPTFEKSTSPLTTECTEVIACSNSFHSGHVASVEDNQTNTAFNNLVAINCTLLRRSRSNSTFLPCFPHKLWKLFQKLRFSSTYTPGEASIWESNSNCSRIWQRFPGSPDLWRAIINSWILWENEAGDWSYKRKK